ncbi:hypothetical protein BH23VER1_BH23VER1_15220 [soil metagenome]
MKFRLSPSLTALLVAAATAWPAAIPAQELQPSQLDTILKKLEDIQAKLDRGKQGNNARVMGAVDKALGDSKAAVDLYQNCVRSEVFEKDERKVTAFNEWKSRMAPLHRSKPFAAALHCHLLFLKASLKATAAAQDEDKSLDDVIPAINEFLNYYYQVEPMLAHPEEADSKIGGGLRGDFMGFRNESIFDNAIGQYFAIRTSSPPIDGWPGGINETDALYDQILNPYYRSEGKSEALIAGWDRRIAALKNRADERENIDQYARATDMRQKELPKLIWGRSKDLYLYGNKALGASEMLKVIETYLESEMASQWISELTTLLAGPQSPDEGTAGQAPADGVEEEGTTIGDLLNAP